MNDCPLSRFPGGLTTLHLAGDEAIKCGWACSANDKKQRWTTGHVLGLGLGLGGQVLGLGLGKYVIVGLDHFRLM